MVRRTGGPKVDACLSEEVGLGVGWCGRKLGREMLTHVSVVGRQVTGAMVERTWALGEKADVEYRRGTGARVGWGGAGNIGAATSSSWNLNERTPDTESGAGESRGCIVLMMESADVCIPIC